jgi:signal transduction histidine kinase
MTGLANPLRILLLEQSSRDADLVQQTLRAAGVDCILDRAQSREEFLASLQEKSPDLILADYLLPNFGGLSALHLARAHCPKVPFLFVSGSIGEERAIEALRSGATDCVRKDRLERLGPAVRRALQEAQEGGSRGPTDPPRIEEALRGRAEQLAEDVRRRDEFVAMLSHELRNPLAPITNSLYLLGRYDVPDPTFAEARAVIGRQVQHLALLVEDLLDTFQVLHGWTVLRPERLDLVRLIRAAAEDQAELLRAAGLELSFEFPGGPVWVAGDPRRLAQVVRHLVRNASKFTGRGGRVTIAVAADTRQDRAAVRVRDTGRGIEADLLPRVFDAFSQGETGLARSGGGLGLGLTLVKGLIELHGGQVSGSSKGPGQGSEFTFWLPRAAEARPPLPVTPPAPPAGGKCLRVLIVEDNRDTARTLGMLLSRAGYEVADAPTGRAGITVARDWLPDVVLCDLGLPEMDGFEVAETLRGDPATASASLIAISGYGCDDVRQRCKQSGFDLHLTKPVDPVEIQRILAGLAPVRR